MAKKGKGFLISILVVILLALIFLNYIQITGNATKVSRTCTTGYFCKDSNYLGYQLSTCRWANTTFCQYGCSNSSCKIAPINDTNPNNTLQNTTSVCGNNICEAGEKEASCVDCNCYLGMYLNNSFIAFSNSSPWRSKIVGPVLDLNSSLMINKLVQSLYQSTNISIIKPSFIWAYPIHLVNSKNCINATVYIRSDSSNPIIDSDRDKIIQAPIPNEAWPEPTTDGHMIILDHFLMRDWEFSRIYKISGTNNSWNTTNAFSWDLNSEGYTKEIWADSTNTTWKSFWWTYGANGAGTPLIAGLIRPEEIEKGEINHALMAAVPTTRNNPSVYSSSYSQFCNPVAGKSDGQNVGNEYILEGTRMQLDPTLNLSTLGLSREAEIIAKAMQIYGMYITDGAKDFQIYFQNLGGNNSVNPWITKYPQLYNDITKIPVSSFRVLKCSNLISRV